MKFAVAFLALGVSFVFTGCAASPASGSSKASADEAGEIAHDYAMLTGEWQLVRAVVNGVETPADQVRNTILITDGGTFRFPQAAGVGTHPAGSFTINPRVEPHQVDSTAIGGVNAGQRTLGIYQIIDANNKRACWGPPGGPRPDDFVSPPGSHRILQYWRKIGPVPPAAPANP